MNQKEYYKNIAEECMARSMYEDAMILLNKVRSSSENEAFYNNIGICQLKLEKYEEAKLSFDKAIDLDSDNAESYFNRGILYYSLKNYEAAFKDYEKSLLISPQAKFNYKIYHNMGNIYIEMKEYDKALTEYSKAIELNSKSDLSFQNKGRTFMKLKQFEECDSLF